MLAYPKRGSGAAIAMAMGALLAGTAVADDETITWRIQSNLNEGEPGYVAVQEKFADLVEEMSDGRMQFQVYSVDSLFSINDGLEAVASGIAEIGVLTGGYYSGQVGPFATLENGVPGALRTPIESFTFFYNVGFLDLAREAYGEHGVYYLGPQISSAWDMMSKEKITSKEDFEGLRVRAFGLEADWYEEMGASAVMMSGGEIYTGLATGGLDAARWSSPAGNYNNSFHEVTDYYIEPSPMPVPNNFFAVNQDAWDSLPSDLQAIMQQAVIASSIDYLARAKLEDAEAMQKMQDYGIEISQIPDDEWLEMEEIARELWQEYAEEDEFSKRGVEMLNSYLETLGR